MTDEQRYLFDLQGYLVVRGAITPDELAVLNKIIDRRELPPPGETYAEQVFSGFLTWGQAFTDLLDHRAVLPLLQGLLPKPRLDRCYGLRMRAGTSGLPLHGYEIDAEDAAEYYAFRHGRMSNGVITVSWALTDMLSGQGGLVCIPGSHKSNYLLPEHWDYRAEPVRHVEMAAGDVLLFSSAMVHGTHPWSAEHERRSVMYKYAPGHLAWSRAYLEWPDELRSGLSAQQRQLLDPPYCVPRHQDPT